MTIPRLKAILQPSWLQGTRARVMTLTALPLLGFAIVGAISMGQQSNVSEKLAVSARYADLGSATKAFGRLVSGLQLQVANARLERTDAAEKAFVTDVAKAKSVIAGAVEAAPSDEVRSALQALAGRLTSAEADFNAFAALRSKLGRSEKQGQTLLFSDAANDVEKTVRRTLGYFRD